MKHSGHFLSKAAGQPPFLLQFFSILRFTLFPAAPRILYSARP